MCTDLGTLGITMGVRSAREGAGALALEGQRPQTGAREDSLLGRTAKELSVMNSKKQKTAFMLQYIDIVFQSQETLNFPMFCLLQLAIPLRSQSEKEHQACRSKCEWPYMLL